MKPLFLIFFLAILASCSSLEEKASKLKVGSTKNDVFDVMGAPPYKYEFEGIHAWRYAVVRYMGVCDYREFYIYRDTVIYTNDYLNSSIAGCTVGLKDIDWEPLLAKAKEYDNFHPLAKLPGNQVNSKSIVQELKELSELKDSGALSEAEYSRAKEQTLNGQ